MNCSTCPNEIRPAYLARHPETDICRDCVEAIEDSVFGITDEDGILVGTMPRRLAVHERDTADIEQDRIRYRARDISEWVR